MSTTKRTVETDAYARMMSRMIKAYGRRVADKDIAELRGLAQFALDAEQVLGEAVARLRTEEGGSYSWAQIGDQLGITRASAQQRFARFCTEPGRKAGGQPANLR